MVDKFKEILAQIVSDKGEVILFALMKMDEITDKWTVILSASWATEANRQEVFDYLKSIISAKLTAEEKINIARIGIFGSNDNSTLSLLQFHKDTHISEDTKVNGFVVHEGYILESKPQGTNTNVVQPS